jgi:hypothetical protein
MTEGSSGRAKVCKGKENKDPNSQPQVKKKKLKILKLDQHAQV